MPLLVYLMPGCPAPTPPQCFLPILRKESSLCHMVILPFIIASVPWPRINAAKDWTKTKMQNIHDPKPWYLKTQHRKLVPEKWVAELL